MESLSEEIARQPDMELVDDLASPDALGTALRGRQVDIVIVERLEGEPVLPMSELLYESPWLRVLSISVAGPEVTLHMLRPQEETLGNMSLAALLRTIRDERPIRAADDMTRSDDRMSDVHDRRPTR
jgi:hypothetical protein